MDDLIFDLQVALGCCLVGAGLMGMAYLWLEWQSRQHCCRPRPTRADIDAALLAGDVLVTADAVPTDMVAMEWRPLPRPPCWVDGCPGHATLEGKLFHSRTRNFERDLAAWARSGEPEHAFTNC